MRFSVVGVVAFVVDAAVLQGSLRLGLDHYSGRLVSYLVAATAAWALNRHYTFRLAWGRGLLSEWAQYLVANAVGGLVNYSTYAVAVCLSAAVRDWPVLGVAAGSIAGLSFNFVANKYYVFRHGAGVRS
jgi:putative flippase GtrA